MKSFKRVSTCKYYEVAYYVEEMLVFKCIEYVITPNFPEMAFLVHAVIGEYFMLFDNFDELAEGKTKLKTFRSLIQPSLHQNNCDKEGREITENNVGAFNVY